MEAYRHRVQYYETDRMGITHHSNYIRWMEEARVDFLRRAGWPYERLEAEGIISPVTAISCRFKASTSFPDEILIDVSVSEFKGAILKLEYLMTDLCGKTVFEGHSEHCFLDKDGKLVRLTKACPELAGIFEALAKEAAAAGPRDA